ncbi:IS3 family transposase [Flaviflexus sp.]
MLLETIGLGPSTYYYTLQALAQPDKYILLRQQIDTIAYENGFTYGALRIWLELKKRSIRVSEKVVRRLMKEERIPVRYAKTRTRYYSYVGEISPAPPNHVNGNFHADEPYLQMLTDVTEFAAVNGKLYLSPILDCFDGLAVAYHVSRHPDKELANATLRAAIKALPPARRHALETDPDVEPLYLHSDRGGLGEFNRLSQHLDPGGVQQWQRSTGLRKRVKFLKGPVGSGVRIERCVRRCARRAGPSPPGRCSDSSGV